MDSKARQRARKALSNPITGDKEAYLACAYEANRYNQREAASLFGILLDHFPDDKEIQQAYVDANGVSSNNTDIREATFSGLPIYGKYRDVTFHQLDLVARLLEPREQQASVETFYQIARRIFQLKDYLGRDTAMSPLSKTYTKIRSILQIGTRLASSIVKGKNSVIRHWNPESQQYVERTIRVPRDYEEDPNVIITLFPNLDPPTQNAGPPEQIDPLLTNVFGKGADQAAYVFKNLTTKHWKNLTMFFPGPEDEGTFEPIMSQGVLSIDINWKKQEPDQFFPLCLNVDFHPEVSF